MSLRDAGRSANGCCTDDNNCAHCNLGLAPHDVSPRLRIDVAYADWIGEHAILFRRPDTNSFPGFASIFFLNAGNKLAPHPIQPVCSQTHRSRTMTSLLQARMPWADETEVKIDNFTFNPPRLAVKAEATVKWMNEEDIPHTVASSTKLFKSKALDTQDAFSFTFATPGVYEYFCSLHPHMTATIIVEAAVGGGPR
jgi:plastocyanin